MTWRIPMVLMTLTSVGFIWGVLVMMHAPLWATSAVSIANGFGGTLLLIWLVRKAAMDERELWRQAVRDQARQRPGEFFPTGLGGLQ